MGLERGPAVLVVGVGWYRLIVCPAGDMKERVRAETSSERPTEGIRELGIGRVTEAEIGAARAVVPEECLFNFRLMVLAINRS